MEKSDQHDLVLGVLKSQETRGDGEKHAHHIQKHDGQESDRAWPAWMSIFQGLIVPDKPNNLLQRDAWLGGWGECSE